MVLYERIVDCCGCGACMNACPKDAIIMKSDKCGFIYPHINLQKCIECGLCAQSCRFINSETSAPQKVYAAANQNYNEIMNSASGGVFTAVAREFLKSGGVVFGATLSFDNGHANPHHIQIESVDDLWKLQGSKYVHSEIGFTYSHTRIALQAGKKVLFSGTPCQIAGLKSYLKKDYNGLYTIDLICHGVPSGQFFDDYIQHKTHHIGATIKSFNFRDKHLGWGQNISLEYEKNDQKHIVYRPARLESYCSLFLDGITLRENCYRCPYAKTERIGDITIGDYWAFESVHPELKNNPAFEERRGISCILVTSEKGRELCESIEKTLCLYDSELNKVVMHNQQLRKPSQKPLLRSMFLEEYTRSGYDAVEKLFKHKFKKQLFIHYVYNKIPRKIRLKLKSLIRNFT